MRPIFNDWACRTLIYWEIAIRLALINFGREGEMITTWLRQFAAYVAYGSIRCEESWMSSVPKPSVQITSISRSLSPESIRTRSSRSERPARELQQLSLPCGKQMKFPSKPSLETLLLSNSAKNSGDFSLIKNIR